MKEADLSEAVTGRSDGLYARVPTESVAIGTGGLAVGLHDQFVAPQQANGLDSARGFDHPEARIGVRQVE